MVNLRPFVFAEADQHHFVQPGFDWTDEFCVGFDSPDNEHVIGFGGKSVKMHRHAVGSLSDDTGFHRGTNRHFDELFRDAQTGQHFDLAFGGSSTMAAHRGDEKRCCPDRCEVGRDFPQNQSYIGDTATAGRNRHALSRSNFLRQAKGFHLSTDFAGDISDPRGLESLDDVAHSGEAGHGNSLFESDGKLINPGSKDEVIQ